VQYILTGQSGEFAQILSQQNCGNQTILKVMTQRWNQNVAGIPFLRVNVLNVARHSRGCGYHQSNGFVNAVAGKMSCKFVAKQQVYSLRSLQISRPLTLLIVFNTAAEAAIISRSSPPRYKRPKLPTATISRILIEAAFSASLAASAA
jgi:hypothetical protein